MKRTDTLPISAVMGQVMSSNRLCDGLNKVRVLRLWKETVEPYIANATTEIYVENAKLYVSISSAIIRNELSIIRLNIIDEINNKLGKIFIKELIIR